MVVGYWAIILRDAAYAEGHGAFSIHGIIRLMNEKSVFQIDEVWKFQEHVCEFLIDKASTFHADLLRIGVGNQSFAV